MNDALIDLDTLRNGILDAIEAAVRRQAPDGDLPPLQAKTPDREGFGDLSVPCHPLARVLRRAPKQIAEELVGAMDALPAVTRAEAVNGFLNIHIDPGAFFAAALKPVLADPDGYGRAPAPTGQRVMVEFSSPNTNKPLHLGHIRNNLLGMTAANLLEAAGDDVVRANLVNDRGIHICKSMLAYQRHGEGLTPADAHTKGDLFVGGWYVRFDVDHTAEKARLAEAIRAEGVTDDEEVARLVDERSELLAEAHDMLRRWEARDPEVRALWARMNGWVYEGFERTYERLGIRFDRTYYESETYEFGRQTVLEALEGGVVERGDDGAVFIDLSDDGLDRKMLLRSDGTSLYITQDIGTTQLKQQDFDLDRSVFVVGSEQDYHFKVLFKTLERMGFGWARGCQHLSYGMVFLPEGKMKSRQGTVVDADDLSAEVVASVRARMLERDEELKTTERDCASAVAAHSQRALEEIDAISEAVGMGALKFYMLKYGARKDFTFNPEESISLQGDTGPYVQFAYTRIVGILRKAGIAGVDGATAPLADADLGALGNPEERALARLLGRFPREIEMSARSLNPAAVCAYLLQVAQAFHRFVHDHKVLYGETEGLVAARLCLCIATATVLRSGLALLGIDAPPRM
jgi:arginyl-tRNA synthetase